MPLLRLWGTVRYAPLLVRRQYGTKQFIPMTFDLASVDLDYHGEGYRNMLSTIAVDWKERYESGLLFYTDQTTIGYDA